MRFKTNLAQKRADNKVARAKAAKTAGRRKSNGGNGG